MPKNDFDQNFDLKSVKVKPMMMNLGTPPNKPGNFFIFLKISLNIFTSIYLELNKSKLPTEQNAAKDVRSPSYWKMTWKR